MPSLSDVISDLSLDPWRLDDFTAYLSKNHCLETLQFVQDASRYQACYAEIVEGIRIPWVYLRCHYDYLQALWEHLMDAYILPGGYREVNLPCEVRARLLGFRSSDFPPHPSELSDAVRSIHELMEDSILPGFLDSQVSLEQPAGRGCCDLRGTSGRLRQKISKTTSERDHQRKFRVREGSGSRASGLGGDGEGSFCRRRYLLGGALASPRCHLLRRAMESFDHTVRGVGGIRWWLKPPLGKDGSSRR
ncbi:RGS domain-containing protein [Dactylonectria estremocensis]|uniref:RGS domain-containing protein n=1 Tax=Dactylonectria estremocensis TaxID=1079267 RepID=A0A9P9D400_9HYPO|nr:RGS domain-containing protein [Dactylonectria estremocensis]